MGGNSATRYDLRSFPLCSLLTHNTTTHNPPTPSSLRASYALRSFTPLVNPSSAPPFAHGEGPLGDAPRPAFPQRVVVQASASLTTQLNVVLAAWGRLGDAP